MTSPTMEGISSRRGGYLALKTVEPTFQAVEPLIVTVEPGFDHRQIVAVVSRLFENVPGDGFFAADLALDDVHARLEVVKFCPGYVRRHSPDCLDSSIAWVVAHASSNQCHRPVWPAVPDPRT